MTERDAKVRAEEHLSPDELRAAAEKMTTPFHGDDRVVSAPDDREWWAALKTARDATRRLADVIEHIEGIARSNRADSPYPFERYAHEDALRTLAIARGDTNDPREEL